MEIQGFSNSNVSGVTIVTDGVTTVTSATEITFVGATVTNGGGGNAIVSVTGIPGGANTNVQYNDSGVFGGDAGMTWNKTTRAFSLTSAVSTSGVNITSTIMPYLFLTRGSQPMYMFKPQSTSVFWAHNATGISGSSTTFSQITGQEVWITGMQDNVGGQSGFTVSWSATSGSPGTITPINYFRISNSGITRLGAYGSGTFTGTATRYLAVDSTGIIIEEAVPSSSIVIGTTPITSGTDTRVLFQDGSVVGEDAGFSYNKTNDTVIMGSGGSSSGTGQRLRVSTAPTATASYGTAQFGAGTFSGSASGTSLAVSEGATFAGKLLDLQTDGSPHLTVSRFTGVYGDSTAMVFDGLHSIFTNSYSGFGIASTNGDYLYLGNMSNQFPFVTLNAIYELDLISGGGAGGTYDINLKNSASGIRFTAKKDYNVMPFAPTASANYGSLSIGGGAFDGATSGFFVGSSSGTSLAVNEVSGYAGDLADLQVAGVPKFRVSSGGAIRYQTFVSPKATTPITVAATDSGTAFTNEGASAEIVFNLPTAVANITYTFVVQDSDGVKVVANTGDTIRLAGVVSGTAGYAESLVVGSTITLVAINATEWVATASNGSWTVI